MTYAGHGGATAAPSLNRGAAIGRYVVLGLVGCGAMGEVYAAYDPELDRKVAVKLLRTQGGADDLTSSEAKSRLLREAQAIARLSHPNVIVVHDVGSFGDRVFIAMEFVDGHTVGYWLLATQRPWKEVLRVFMAAGHGLAAAHASQLVHRDFKLENVMVGRDGHVRVMDFGLARRVANASSDEGSPATLQRHSAVSASSLQIPHEATETVSSTRNGHTASTSPMPDPRASIEVDLDATHKSPSRQGSGADSKPNRSSAHKSAVHTSLSTDLTQTGAIIGTPAYMAPEQFDGHPADERSDQFSFCVALFEGLYGARPFAGKTFGELSDNVRKGQVRLPPDTTRVPGWLRRVVSRGLRNNPAERWPSMDTLLAALEKDPRVLWRRGLLIATAVAAIAVISVVARRQGALENRPTCLVSPDRFARVWEASPVPGSRRAAIAAAFQASGQPYAADALAGATRLLNVYVAAWSSMYADSCEATNVRGEQSADVLDLRTSCLRDRWNELRALSDVLAEPNSGVVVNAVKAAAALTSIDRCADVRTLRAAVAPPNDPARRARVESLRTRLATTKALEDAGRYTAALTAAVPLVADARATEYAPVVAEALYRLGMVQVSMSRSNEATTNLDEAIWLAEAARYDELVAAASIEQIAAAGTVDGDMTRARRWFRQAESFLARMDGHEVLRAWMENNFAMALEAHGELEESVTRYRTALEVKKTALGASHFDVGHTLTNLAGVLGVLGRSEEALQLSNRGVAIMEQSLGTQHPDTAIQLANRAAILNDLGRYADARRDAQGALAVWEKELGTENVDLPNILGPLGAAFLGLEQPGKAVGPLNRALSIAEHNALHSELRKLRFNLAQALWRSGIDRKRAIELGSLASLPRAPSADSRDGPVLSSLDQELQTEALAWVSARATQMRGNQTTRHFAAGATR